MVRAGADTLLRLRQRAQCDDGAATALRVRKYELMEPGNAPADGSS